MYKKKEISFFHRSTMESIPEDGWLQNCKYCKNTITGNLMFLKLVEGIYSSKTYNVFVCKDCIKVLEYDESKKASFDLLCNKLVYDYHTTKNISQKNTKVLIIKN
tara:strand:- start:6398 stop:6712 length:315 start_codon:yes stop_codon:yes gene_type:complete